MTRFTAPAPGVHVLRYPVLDVNVTLVRGDAAALLVDTLATDAQARELVAAARAVTTHPWTVVNTHHHFDHCLGNAVLAGDGVDIWAHEETAAQLAEHGSALQRQWYEQWATTRPQLAADLAAVQIVPPELTVRHEATVHVGDRPVVLRHLGRGHTAGDLVVQVPDADVVIAGDLVEQGAPPSFEDSFPLEWAETLAALLALLGPDSTVIPGHGAPVGREFVVGQHQQLTDLAWLIREGHRDGVPAEAVAARAPYDPETALTAIKRGYTTLSGENNR